MNHEREIEQIVEGVTNTSHAVGTPSTPALDWVLGELFGTFVLVFLGCGSVAAAVLLGPLFSRAIGQHHKSHGH